MSTNSESAASKSNNQQNSSQPSTVTQAPAPRNLKMKFLKKRPLRSLAIDNKLISRLFTDPEQEKYNPNESRAVKKGHFHWAVGEKLKNPELVCISRSFMDEIGLQWDVKESDQFIRVFSSDNSCLPKLWCQNGLSQVRQQDIQKQIKDSSNNNSTLQSYTTNKNLLSSVKSHAAWATSYGVSIHGHWGTNSPFGNFGYGDGRAMSVVEVKGSRGENSDVMQRSSNAPQFIVQSEQEAQGQQQTQESEDSNIFVQGVKTYILTSAKLKTAIEFKLEPAHADRSKLGLLSEYSWELQLKGAGRTAYSRNHDGRAVLRSSIREFITSEAFHHLGVPSTRALSLCVSTGDDMDTVVRQWYFPSTHKDSYNQIMRQEPCAITTRSSSSFLRVGQIELFARTRPKSEFQQILQFAMDRDFSEIREEWLKLDDGKEAMKRERQRRGLPPLDGDISTDMNNFISSESLSSDNQQSNSLYESDAQQLFDPRFDPPTPLTPKHIIRLAEIFSERQCRLHAEWIRVGYIQGNMNNDNALLCGRSMDFGPFSMLEEYNKTEQSWEGGQVKFSYSHQPFAGNVIFMTLCQALIGLFDDEESKQTEVIDGLQELLKNYMGRYKLYHNENCRRKLGLMIWDGSEGSDYTILWNKLETILEDDKMDFTWFFRSLTNVDFSKLEYTDPAVNESGKPNTSSQFTSKTIDYLNSTFEIACHKDRTKISSQLRDWLLQWIILIKISNTSVNERPLTTLMKKTSPTLIPRNWMMTLAYEAAEKNNDYSVVQELHKILEKPYLDPEQIEKEYGKCVRERWCRKSPDWQFMKAGVRNMT